MKFRVEQSIIDKYKNTNLGILIVQNAIVLEHDAALNQLRRDVVSTFVQKNTVDSLSAHPYILAWKEQYASFGVKKKKRQPASETLLMGVLSRKDLLRINTIVDLCNLVCIESFLPVGVYDLDAMRGDLYLRYVREGDEFIPIGSNYAEILPMGEIIYSDDLRVLTKRWNQRDSELVKVTPDSRNVYLSVEGAEHISLEDVTTATNKLASYVRMFCGGEIKIHIGRLSELNNIQLVH